MRRFTRPLAVSTGVAVALGAVVLAAAPGQAQEGSPELIKLSLAPGYVLLDTAADTVTSPGSSSVQTIVEGCSLNDVFSPAATLLDVTAISTAAPRPDRVSLGYGKNGIGVAGRQDKNGTRCADVDDEYDQAIEVSAGAEVSLFSAADLDLEFKGGSGLELQVFRGDTLLVEDSDYTVTGEPGDASDNGPDSADGDNSRVVIAAIGSDGYFDRIRLTPTNGGALSLEGGGDGTDFSSLLPTTRASVFQTLGGEGQLFCDKTDTDGVTENGVTVFLTDCAAGSSVPYQLDRPAGTNDVIFAVPDSSTNAYRVFITWEPETAQLPVPKNSTVAYYREVGGNLVEQPLDLCDGTSASPTVPDDVDYDPNANGNQGFCITGQSMEIGPTGKMIVTEKLYGVGDPIYGRLAN